MLDTFSPEYKKFAKERTDKEAFDKDLISEAVEKALLHQTSFADTHFIIGSQYHGAFQVPPRIRSKGFINDRNTERLAISTRLFGWISSEIKDIGLQSLYCTIYVGTREFLITPGLSVACYDGKIKQRQVNLSEEISEEIFMRNMKSSINDDLEDFIQQIRNGCRPSNGPVMLYLYKMLTKNQSRLAKTNNRQFWSTIFDNKIFLIPGFNQVRETSMKCESYEVLLKETKFIFCCASRYTALLK